MPAEEFPKDFVSRIPLLFTVILEQWVANITMIITIIIMTESLGICGTVFLLPYFSVVHIGGTSVCMYMYACMCAKLLSHIQLFVALWPIAHTVQAPLSMGFSRQEYWSGWPCPPPRDLPEPGIEPVSLTSPGLAGRFFTTGATREAHVYV